MTTEEKIAVMQAEVDGKKIEFRSRKGGEWIPVVRSLDWDWANFDYRVAKKPRVFYCNEYDGRFGYIRESAEDAIEHQAEGAIRVVRFVEDMEYRED